MSKKYKVVKISRTVGSPNALWQTEELAKVDAELVEVTDVNKDEMMKAIKDADIILTGSAPRWMIEAAQKCVAIITGNV